MGKKLIVGDLVTIQFDPRDNCITHGMKRFNGQNAIVSRVINSKFVFGRSIGPQYELLGVESSMGVPYTFTRDMLISKEN